MGYFKTYHSEKQICQTGAEKVILSAQVQAKGFYEKQGYSAVGKEFLEEHCLHIRMCKTVE